MEEISCFICRGSGSFLRNMHGMSSSFSHALFFITINECLGLVVTLYKKVLLVIMSECISLNQLTMNNFVFRH